MGDETTPITLPDRLGEDLGFGPGDAAIALGGTFASSSLPDPATIG